MTPFVTGLFNTFAFLGGVLAGFIAGTVGVSIFLLSLMPLLDYLDVI
jgi:hypothetical protein